MENMAPSVRRRLLFTAAASSTSGSAVVETSVRGDRCLVPPPGVGGALRAERRDSSMSAAIEGPASGEDRRGREECMGERDPMVL